MLIEGLAYDRCQVGVVLNIDASTRFPEYAIYDEDQLFSIVRTQIDVVLPNGAAVLNADDPLVAKMAELCDGEVIFFSSNENSPLIEDHLKQGGRAVLVRDQEIVLKTARRDEQVLRLPKNPKSTPDSMQWKSINLAAAIATAWALGIPFNIILAGTETFYSASASQTEA
jgi:cyanophycin synthetase